MTSFIDTEKEIERKSEREKVNYVTKKNKEKKPKSLGGYIFD
jgi:hypothetical protein